MLWPVLLDPHPRGTAWSPGERVTTRLRWLDTPDLPGDVGLHRVRVRATTVRDADGRPWAHLVRAGELTALREGGHPDGGRGGERSGEQSEEQSEERSGNPGRDTGGDLTLDGCLGVDAHLGLVAGLPATTGVVRRVRVVRVRYDRGADGWVRHPGEVRLTDVPDARPEHLRDDPSPTETGPAETGRMMFLSPEQHFRMFRDRLPARRWEARGFLVDLDVAG